MKVILHIDNKNNFDKVFSNIKNLKKEFNKENISVYNIIVVFNGNSVLSLSNYIDQIKKLSSKNIIFNVCRNSLNNFKIDEDSLIKELKVIPSGVFGIMKYQQLNNYSYIKV